MSLTSFLKNKDVKDAFRKEFKKPQLKLQAEILAPPLTDHYALVGTAFDYLLRFYIERLNPTAVKHQWIAEWALEKLGLHQGRLVLYEGRPVSQDPQIWQEIYLPDLEKRKITDPLSDPGLYEKVAKIIQHAKIVYREYTETGKLKPELFETVLLLAQVDEIYRSWHIYEDFGSVDERDMEDLKNLISITKPEYFKAKKICVLNPTFGKASQLVGGADGDLIIDDMLIDIKTTKKLELRRDYFNQLIGYYILYQIGGIEGLPPTHKIQRLGIYFSRYSYLFFINVSDIINEDTFPEFVEWFKERAHDEYGRQI